MQLNSASPQQDRKLATEAEVTAPRTRLGLAVTGTHWFLDVSRSAGCVSEAACPLASQPQCSLEVVNLWWYFQAACIQKSYAR